MAANDKQVGGSHYNKPIQHWDFVVANNIPYLEAQVMKYVFRHREKNGLQDLEKAKHFLEKLIETETARYKAIDAAKEAERLALQKQVAEGFDRAAALKTPAPLTLTDEMIKIPEFLRQPITQPEEVRRFMSGKGDPDRDYTMEPGGTDEGGGRVIDMTHEKDALGYEKGPAHEGAGPGYVKQD